MEEEYMVTVDTTGKLGRFSILVSADDWKNAVFEAGIKFNKYKTDPPLGDFIRVVDINLMTTNHPE